MKHTYSIRNFVRDIYYLGKRQKFLVYALMSKRPIVLCFSMGKVGSTSILRALERTPYRNGVQHVHFLSASQLEDVIDEHREAGFKILPAHIHASRRISKVLPQIRQDRFRFICPVRDPIAFSISNFFQNPYFFRKELQFPLNSATEISSFLISKVLYRGSNSLNYWNRWFQIEVEENFGVTMRDRSFSKDRGWDVYELKGMRFGVVKLERMNAVFEEFSDSLLGLKVSLPERAANERGSGNPVYARVLEELRLNDATLDEIYQMEWVKYFYTEAEIEQFKRKWGS